MSSREEEMLVPPSPSSSHLEEGEKVTFPMRPKKKILVRKALPGVGKGRGEDRASPTGGKDRAKRKVFVSKSINPDDLEFGESVTDTGDVVYSSPFGKFSPTKAKGHARNAQPRRDNSGKILPYSILGDVHEYERLSGVSVAVSKSISRTSVRSSRRSSAALENMRNSRSLATPSSSMSSLTVPPSATTVGTTQEPLTPPPKSPEEYLEDVRQLAASETRKRQEQAEKKIEAERKRRLAGMLTHERLMYDRQERALKLYQHWQEEWAQFKSAMCKLSNKKPEDLVVSRAVQYRKRTEEYNFINAATPHHEKHGSEYWMMSLRGMGTRYVAVGNIFSGLFCPVRESANTEMETIRYPDNLSTISETDTAKPTWKHSPILNQRRRQLAKHLKQVRPHCITDEDAAGLIIAGEPLLEWAYVSIEKRGLEEQKASLRKQALSTASRDIQQASAFGDELLGEEENITTGPSFSITALDPDGDGETTQTGNVVTLRTEVHKATTGYAEINNTGTTALYYKWNKLDSPEINGELGVEQDNAVRFFCSDESGVVLPSESCRLAFVFKSATPGSWSEMWQLSTLPDCSNTLSTITLRGIAFQVDKTRPARLLLQNELENNAKERAEELARKAAIAHAPPTPPPPPTLEEKKASFERFNRSLGLFFHPELEESFNKLAVQVFSQLRAFDMVCDESQLKLTIQGDVDKWMSSPSLVGLRETIQKIKHAEILFPSCRARTTLSSSAASSSSDLSSAGESSVDEAEPASSRASEPADVAADASKETTNQKENDLDDEDDIDYLEKEKKRLWNIGQDLDAELLDLGKKCVRKQVTLSPYYTLVRDSLLHLADTVVEIYDVPDCTEDEETEGEPANDGEQELDADGNAIVRTKEEKLQCRAVAIMNDMSRSCFDVFHRHTSAYFSAISPSIPRAMIPFSSTVLSGEEEPVVSLRNKRVVIQVDLSIRPLPSTSDRLEYDEEKVNRKLARVQRTVDRIAAQGPKSVVLYPSSRNGAVLTSTYAYVAEELATTLGREVVYVDNALDEDIRGTLIGSEEEDEVDETPKDPVVVEADDVPVFLMDELSNAKSDESATGMKELLLGYSEVLILDSLEGLAIENQGIVSLLESSKILEKIIGGDILELELKTLETLLEKRHTFVIGGVPSDYPVDEVAEDNDDEELDDTESLISGNGDDSSTSESASEDEASDDEHDDANEEEVAEALETEERVEENLEPASTEEEKVKLEDFSTLECGFFNQLKTIAGLLDSEMAASIVLTESLAVEFKRAVAEFGKGSSRLLSPFELDDLSFFIPEKEADVRNVFEVNTYRSYEREEMRRIVELARAKNIPLLFVALDADEVPAVAEVESDDILRRQQEEERSKTMRKLMRQKIRKLTSWKSFVILDSFENQYYNRVLLRELGKSRAKPAVKESTSEEAEDGRDGTVSSAPEPVGTVTDVFVLDQDVWNQVEMIKRGEVDHEVEEELEEDAEDEEEVKDDESETEEQSGDEASEETTPVEGDGEAAEESQEEEVDPFHMEQVITISNKNCLEILARGKALHSLENASRLIQEKYTLPEPTEETVDKPEQEK